MFISNFYDHCYCNFHDPISVCKLKLFLFQFQIVLEYSLYLFRSRAPICRLELELLGVLPPVGGPARRRSEYGLGYKLWRWVSNPIPLPHWSIWPCWGCSLVKFEDNHRITVFILWMVSAIYTGEFSYWADYWFKICRITVPYPFQWGASTFHAAECFAMMAAAFVALVEVLWITDDI